MTLDDDCNALFAYRWPRSAFSSLKEFCQFCDRYAHLFPLMLREFDARVLELYLLEENLSLSSAPNPIRRDIRDVIDVTFGSATIPWLKQNQYATIDDASTDEACFYRAMGSDGFFAALVQQDFNDELADGEQCEVGQLPIKKDDAASPSWVAHQ